MKKNWQERAWELLKEQLAERLRPDEWAQERLGWEDWERLRKRAVAFAEEQIGRRRWRGEKGGRLPEGADAESVAAEAAATLLRGKARLAPGWTRERLELELERQVGQEVRRLHGLKEASRTRNEWDILPPEKDKESKSIFEGMAGAIPDGAVDMMRAEGEAKLERLKGEIEATLEGAAEARALLACLCNGVVKRREIAMKLGIDVRAVSSARKRLNLKLEQFGQTHQECPRGFIEELKRL